MPINCDCSDTTGFRTMAQLRTELFTRLGFVDPLANVGTRTLAQLRADIARRSGMAAQVAAGSYPPGVSDLLDNFINEAEQTLFRRLELDKGSTALPTRMSADGAACTLDYMQVFNLALGLYKAHRGDADAKVYFEMVEKYLGDVANRRPPNATALCTNFLQDAQRQILRRAPGLRVDRWFSWSLVAGERFYDFDDNDELTADPACDKQIDQYAIHWVGVARAGSTSWTPLTRGIPPEVLGNTTTGYPTRYELRQCIEVWPAPAASEGTLQIRAGFKLEPFAADGDTPTVDDHLVFLLALANAKAHWKQQDAKVYFDEFEVHLGNMIAGTHAGNTYLPGQRATLTYVEPVPTVPFT